MDFQILGSARAQVNGARGSLQQAQQMTNQLIATGGVSPDLGRCLGRLQAAVQLTTTALYNTLTGLGVVR